MIYCPACLAENDPLSMHCENCGHALVPASASPATAEPEELSIPSAAASEPMPAIDGEPEGSSPPLLKLPIGAESRTELPTLEPMPEEVAVMGAAEQVPGAEGEVAAEGVEERSTAEKIVCPSCRAVLRFCPCCGQRLSTQHVKE